MLPITDALVAHGDLIIPDVWRLILKCVALINTYSPSISAHCLVAVVSVFMVAEASSMLTWGHAAIGIVHAASAVAVKGLIIIVPNFDRTGPTFLSQINWVCVFQSF